MPFNITEPHAVSPSIASSRRYIIGVTTPPFHPDIDDLYSPANITKFERSNIDGVTFSLLYPDPNTPYGSTHLNANQAIGNRTVTNYYIRYKALKDGPHGVDAFKARTFRKWTQNFLRIDMRVADVDWFSPNYSVVIDNFAVAARAVAELRAEGKAVGIFLDTEPYVYSTYDTSEVLVSATNEPTLWKHSTAILTATKTPTEYNAQILARAHEIADAILSECPDIVLMTALGPREIPLATPDTHAYGMYGSFLQGLKDRFLVAGSKAELHFGDEKTYSLINEVNFTGDKAIMDGLALYDDVVGAPPLGRAPGLWFDYDAGPQTWSYALPDTNYRTPAGLKQQLIWAGQHLSTKYIWLYSQIPKFQNTGVVTLDVPTPYFVKIHEAKEALFNT